MTDFNPKFGRILTASEAANLPITRQVLDLGGHQIALDMLILAPEKMSRLRATLAQAHEPLPISEEMRSLLLRFAGDRVDAMEGLTLTPEGVVSLMLEELATVWDRVAELKTKLEAIEAAQ